MMIASGRHVLHNIQGLPNEVPRMAHVVNILDISSGVAPVGVVLEASSGLQAMRLHPLKYSIMSSRRPSPPTQQCLWSSPTRTSTFASRHRISALLSSLLWTRTHAGVAHLGRMFCMRHAGGPHNELNLSPLEHDNRNARTLRCRGVATFPINLSSSSELPLKHTWMTTSEARVHFEEAVQLEVLQDAGDRIESPQTTNGKGRQLKQR